MPTRSLPVRPNLAQLKIQGHELLRQHRDGQRSAAARIVAHHPKFTGQPIEAVLATPIALADAQLVVAREYGFPTWAKLKQRIELAARLEQIAPHPRFDEAVAAMDAGDLDGLRKLLAAEPSLVHARTNLDPAHGYFAGATLLHHVAGNPDRGRLSGERPPLPANSAAIARALLDAGADVHAVTLGPNAGDTMGLLLTSKQASDADVAGPLVDVLVEYGARLDLTSADALDASLINHAPRAAEKLIALGAKPDLLAAAALGRIDLLRGFFDKDGDLLSRPTRRGRELSSRDAIGLAMLYAYVRDEREAVEFLLEHDGNWNMIGVNNGAALHRAACAGDLPMVQRLVGKGADTSNRMNPFNSTPLAWADHNKQQGVMDWLRAHCAIDLHDAVMFDYPEHVDARLREDPSSVNARVDQWDIPQATPLHCAADQGRAALAARLIEKGADVNVIAGNGYTPLDVADFMKAAEVVALLERHGAERAIGARQVSSAAPPAPSSRPLYRVDKDNRIRPMQMLTDAGWDAMMAVMAERKITALEANGQMTDEVIARIVQLDHLTRLDLAGSEKLTDAGVRLLARLPQLQQLDLSGCSVSDRGLAVLRALPDLRRLQLRHPGISDAGTAHLAACHRLDAVVLISPQFTDDTVKALTGKASLSKVRLGGNFTEDCCPRFHECPVFKTWQGGEARYGLMQFEAGPNGLAINPTTPWSRVSLSGLSGLDGLFALNLDNPAWTHVDLAPLAALPNFGWLGHDATDESMREIGAMPRLRMLMAQDTEAGDEGFTALARSATIEYVWGRRCYNLTGRGFRALAGMPALRGLSVSCKNVDDDALATLPGFPSLREFMPMDVPDAGFRHIGRCARLEALWCMYCRDTTDAATEHIAGLTHLKTYYAGQTNITDRSLQILGRMTSLETLEFWHCDGITDAGVAALARLPRLREVTFGDCPQITPAAETLFAAGVLARVS